MSPSKEFLEATLNALPQHISIVDRHGDILWVNKAWQAYTRENGGDLGRTGRGVNYFEICSTPDNQGNSDVAEVRRGMRQVLNHEIEEFIHEYPCHSPNEDSWFLMRVLPIQWNGCDHFVNVHENISVQKRAEIAAAEKAEKDYLTGIANRGRFDTIFQSEWRRAKRYCHPISLVMFDIDDFKVFNDTFGHLRGDECLQQVAETLSGFMNRPTDLVARYGGEEFIMVLGNTRLEDAFCIANRARSAVQDLGIPPARPDKNSSLTLSAGVACAYPALSREAKPECLLAAADHCLYDAKRQGRNRVVGANPQRIVKPLAG